MNTYYAVYPVENGRPAKNGIVLCKSLEEAKKVFPATRGIEWAVADDVLRSWVCVAAFGTLYEISEINTKVDIRTEDSVVMHEEYRDHDFVVMRRYGGMFTCGYVIVSGESIAYQKTCHELNRMVDELIQSGFTWSNNHIPGYGEIGSSNWAIGWDYSHEVTEEDVASDAKYIIDMLIWDAKQYG